MTFSFPKRSTEPQEEVDHGTLEEFKNFYYLLFAGVDLERAMFCLDTQEDSVTKEEFYNIGRY